MVGHVAYYIFQIDFEITEIVQETCTTPYLYKWLCNHNYKLRNKHRYNIRATVIICFM